MVNSRPQSSPSARVPSVNRASFASHGNLAFISNGNLWVLDGTTGQLRLVAAAAQQPADPQFSPNGSWLSYSVASGQIWLAHADGSSPHPVAEGGAGWFPGGELRAGTGLWRVSATGAATRVATAPTGLAAWSPDGGRYAFVSDSLVFTRSATGIDRLEVSSSLTGKRTTWYASKVSFTRLSGAQGNFIDHVVVLPHQAGILFTVDPDMSASIAADGLGLYEIKTPGARPRKLGILTLDPISVASNGTFAFTNGPNRYAWLTKRVETCVKAPAVCSSMRTLDGELSFDPALSPTGSALAFVEAPSSSVTNFFQSTLQRWYATHSLWVLQSGSRSPSEIKDANGASVPVWSANSKSLLYEADDALWLLPTVSSKPVRVAAPLFQPNDWPSYYGQIDWSSQFAWSSPR